MSGCGICGTELELEETVYIRRPDFGCNLHEEKEPA